MDLYLFEKTKKVATNLDINLNLNVRGLSPSATLAINEKSQQLSSEGRNIYFFGLGQSPFPIPNHVVEELRKHAHQKDYLPVKGLLALREAVALYHQKMEGIPLTKEDVLIGPGSKELMFIMQLAYYGDLVIPTPSWVSYAPQAQIIGRKIRWVATTQQDNWKLTPAALDHLCSEDPTRPRILILNYPANPTGDSYTIDELKALADIARKYKVVLLSDEIYSGLHHRAQHVSIARFYPEGTIISGGISKWLGAGGWRLGTFTFPKQLRWLLEAMSVVASETYTATSAPVQYAAIKAFEGGAEIDEYLIHCRRILRALGKEVWRRLTENQAIVTKPRGGFYLFPNFTPWHDTLAKRGIHDSVMLCDRLLEDAGVAILPGRDFGRPIHELTARLAFVDFDGQSVLNASMKMKDKEPLKLDFLEQYCPRVLTGIDLITEWIRGA